MKKKILFVINTLGHAGAEIALLELLKALNQEEYEISLYILLGQGELIKRVPSHVKVLNKTYNDTSVLSGKGKAGMMKTVLKMAVKRGNIIRRAPYLAKNAVRMIQKRQLLADKLLWRIAADGAQRFEETFDLAVAYLEGGASYYVADYVHARAKAAFIHVDYTRAGYTRQLDQNIYEKYDRIFAVSGEVRDSFTKIYPEYKEKTMIFHNMLDIERIRRKAMEDGGFTDDYQGIRLLTVGRLTRQKAYEVAVETMDFLKKEGMNVRWYVLGEGPERVHLERKIESMGLAEDFILLGAEENPFPYYAQTDIYVHATRFEGKSIAIQEAQALGCAIIASDCSGNREQIEDHKDGLLCPLDPQQLGDAIMEYIKNKVLRESMGKAASQKKLVFEKDLELLYELVQNDT